MILKHDHEKTSTVLSYFQIKSILDYRLYIYVKVDNCNYTILPQVDYMFGFGLSCVFGKINI